MFPSVEIIRHRVEGRALSHDSARSPENKIWLIGIARFFICPPTTSGISLFLSFLCFASTADII